MSTVSLIAPAPWKPLRGAVANRYAPTNAVYVRLVKVVAGQSFMGMFKSLDDGVNWVQVGGDKFLGDYNSTNNSFIPGCGTVDPAFPAVIHISYNYYVFGTVTQVSQLNIARFDCSADAWLADTLGPDYSGPRYSIGYAQNSQVGFRSDSTVVLLFRKTQEVPPITLTYEYRVWTAANGEQVLSTVLANNTGGQFVDYTLIGPVIIDPADAAHLFYIMSASGTSTADTSLMYRALDAGDTLTAETIAVDSFAPGNTLVDKLGGVAVEISGVDSVVYGLNDDTSFPTFNPAMLSGPVVGVPTTATVDLLQQPQQYSITKIGNVAYNIKPYSNTSGSRLQGIVFAPFEDGVWGIQVTVNDGLTGEPDFTFYTVNGADDVVGQALLFVMENWDDETAWFAIYPLSEPPAPTLEPRVLWGSTNPQTRPACVELPTPAQWDYLKGGRARNATFSGCVPSPLGDKELRGGPVQMNMPPSRPLRRFGRRWLRCIP